MADFLKTPAGKTRLRGLGIHLDGTPGPNNNITDVGQVEVGYTTLIEGNGKMVVGQGPIRTGVTAIMPRGREGAHKSVMAGIYSLNGNGELTGSHWVEESGFCETPITITNTRSCGVTRDATVKWLIEKFGDGVQPFQLPISGETYDGGMNDINGFHVTADHAIQAMDNAISGPIDMGSVGGGTGMLTFDFKAGSGSASRVITLSEQDYTIGVFVQSNFGRRGDFVLKGAPIGASMRGQELRGSGDGSIIAIIATDAPLMPHQLKRLARRVPLGMARVGCMGENNSGDIFLAFSTANEGVNPASQEVQQAEYLNNDILNPVFEAVVQATEEAIVDAMVCAETMIGCDDNLALGLDNAKMVEIYRKHHPE